jgi:uncharacterized membrane protein
MRQRDDSLERAIGTLLQTGVLIAAVIVLAGGIWRLAVSGGATPHYEKFRGEPVEFRSAGAIVAGVASGDPLSVIQFGLLMLIATPIVRVAYATVAFARRRDRIYTVFGLFVLIVLTATLAGLVRPPH